MVLFLNTRKSNVCPPICTGSKGLFCAELTLKLLGINIQPEKAMNFLLFTTATAILLRDNSWFVMYLILLHWAALQTETNKKQSRIWSQMPWNLERACLMCAQNERKYILRTKTVGFGNIVLGIDSSPPPVMTPRHKQNLVWTAKTSNYFSLFSPIFPQIRPFSPPKTPLSQRILQTSAEMDHLTNTRNLLPPQLSLENLAGKGSWHQKSFRKENQNSSDLLLRFLTSQFDPLGSLACSGLG